MKSLRGRNLRTVGLVLLLSAGLAALGACGKKAPAEKAQEKMLSDMVAKATGGKAEIDFKSGQIKVKPREGDSVITFGGGNWPADLPEEITRFAAGSLQTSSISHVESEDIWAIVLKDVEANAVTEYLEGLKSDGWNVVTTTQGPNVTFTHVQMGKLSIHLTYAPDEKNLGMTVIRQKGE